MKCVKVYYVILLFVYIGYLAVGAAVFRFFEKPYEQAKCEKAKEGKFSEIIICYEYTNSRFIQWGPSFNNLRFLK